MNVRVGLVVLCFTCSTLLSFSGMADPGDYFVSGVVTNYDTGQPVSSGDVNVRNLRTGDTLGTSIGGDGSYSININNFQSGYNVGDILVLTASSGSLHPYPVGTKVILNPPDSTIHVPISLFGAMFPPSQSNYPGFHGFGMQLVTRDETFFNGYGFTWGNNPPTQINNGDDFPMNANDAGVCFSFTYCWHDEATGIPENDHYTVTMEFTLQVLHKQGGIYTSIDSRTVMYGPIPGENQERYIRDDNLQYTVYPGQKKGYDPWASLLIAKAQINKDLGWKVQLNALISGTIEDAAGQKTSFSDSRSITDLTFDF